MKFGIQTFQKSDFCMPPEELTPTPLIIWYPEELAPTPLIIGYPEELPPLH